MGFHFFFNRRFGGTRADVGPRVDNDTRTIDGVRHRMAAEDIDRKGLEPMAAQYRQDGYSAHILKHNGNYALFVAD